MDNATLKFALIAGIALVILYFYTREPYNAYNEDDYNQYASAGDDVPQVTQPKDRKGALLKAATQMNRPSGVGQAPNLLPKPAADAGFGQFAPDPKELTGQNFVDASRWVSLGAMSTKRNISRDLRADVPIPKNNAVSPWNQSTIDMQNTNKPLDCPK